MLLHSEHVGDLAMSGGETRLVYRDGYLDNPGRVPLSLSLPPEPGGVVADRWIDGLLPGRPGVRDMWARGHQAASSHPFDLLSTPPGRDCAGAVQFCPENEVDDLTGGHAGVEWLSDSEYEAQIGDLSNRPRTWGSSPGAGGCSLAGAYPKAGLVRGPDGGWGRPQGSMPSTWIVKPSPADQPQMAVSEFLAMRAASHCGVSAGHVELSVVAGCPVLEVLRFDRIRGQDGRIGRVHQEDLHQACGTSAEIYQAHGGPGPAGMARCLQAGSAAHRQEAEEFLRQLVYRWAAWDTDGHSKNCTLRLGPGGAVAVSPLYDCWSAAAISEPRASQTRMAMWAGDSGLFADADHADYWEDMSTALGIRRRRGLRILASVAERFPEAARKAVEGLPDDDIVEQTAERFTDLADTRPMLPAARAAKPVNPRKAKAADAAPPLEPLPEPRRRCQAWMPRSRAYCVLAQGHPGPHRSRRGPPDRRRA